MHMRKGDIMFALIKKDVLAFNYIIIFQLIIVLGMMSFGLFLDENATMILVVLVMYPMTLPTVLLISDQSYISLCHGLPISRSNYVLAKYIGGISMALFMLSIGLSYGYLVSEYLLTDKSSLQMLYSIKSLGFMMIPILIINSITFPVFFALSKEKGSLVMILLFIVLMLVLIIGLVVAEKSFSQDMTIRRDQVFPMLMKQLGEYIQKIGKTQFITLLATSTLGIVVVSVVSSLLILHRKDIGGA